ncbi:hypothetical protein BDW59DRAFT_165363 [Aspergillus cavernicola]|uniref:RING-type domain-containing protein n=1 Tax=Aspergillus cavernicola TaxID=176166 RepID=A0ABR4HTI0_9EURO
MAPRYSRTQTPPPPHLSEILELEPEKEPWCAGYAPSQGRRCKARTNARGRREAMALLDEGTDDLYASLCIDDILEDLAPHVLCTRFHQNQAFELVARWKKQVQSYLRPRTAQTSGRQLSRAMYPYSGRGLDAVAFQRVYDALDQGRRSQRVSSMPTPSLDSTIYGAARRISSMPTTTGNRPSAETPRRVAEMPSTPRIRTEARITSTEPTQSPRQTTPAPVLDSRVTTPSTAQILPSPSPTPVQAGLDTASHTAQTLSPRQTNPVSGQAQEADTIASTQPTISVPAPTSNSRLNTASSARSINMRHPRLVDIRTTPRTTSLHSHSNDAPRRHTDRDCSICLISLLEPPPGPDDEVGDTDHEAEEDNKNDQRNLSDDEEEQEEETLYLPEGPELSWCKARCGINYHKACIDKWLATSAHAACPTCRRIWRY